MGICAMTIALHGTMDPRQRIIQNFLLIRLDASIDESTVDCCYRHHLPHISLLFLFPSFPRYDVISFFSWYCLCIRCDIFSITSSFLLCSSYPWMCIDIYMHVSLLYTWSDLGLCETKKGFQFRCKLINLLRDSIHSIVHWNEGFDGNYQYKQYGSLETGWKNSRDMKSFLFACRPCFRRDGRHLFFIEIKRTFCINSSLKK
jgi:hypothetical protein